ncbi:MAG: glycosyltransferase [Cyanobacteriota bacterium]|nr:glycosyltransferase [Cyanobacteriota bacterium]
MKIAFADYIGWDYNVESVYQMPLGGSQSALCYLAEALAQQGHEVFLINHTSKPGTSRGVVCLSWNAHSLRQLPSLDLDALVCWNHAELGKKLKPFLSPHTCVVLWAGIAYYQKAMQALENPGEHEVYDGTIFVSDWQRQDFIKHCDIDSNRSDIIRNAIGSAFRDLFEPSDPILPHKSEPPTLVYTSSPERGLEILLDVFPKIRQAVPGTTLKIFSSLKLYKYSDTDDEQMYGQLYRQCEETEGVEYIGCVTQPELARELRGAAVLAYSDTVAETSCISVMEAMASGCSIVTSQLGALPETTAGFARLIPVDGDWETYKRRFVEQTIDVLKEITSSNSIEIEGHLRAQVDYIDRECTWSKKAQEWIEVLEQISSQTASAEIHRQDRSQQGERFLIEGEYLQAETLYEEAIEAEPEERSNYWNLGLALLLQGQEVEAQTTWLSVMMDAPPDGVEAWTKELAGVLEVSAQREKILGNGKVAWAIRQHLRELVPENVKNILHSIELSVELEILDENDEILEWATGLLDEKEVPLLARPLVPKICDLLLAYNPASNSIIRFAEAFAKWIRSYPKLVDRFLDRAAILLQEGILPKAIQRQYAELYLDLQPENLPVRIKLVNLYQDTQKYTESFELLDRCLQQAKTLPDRIAIQYLIMRGLMKAGGNFEKARKVHQDYKNSILELIESDIDIEQYHIIQLISTTSFFSYLADEPRKTNQFRANFSKFFQSKIRQYFNDRLQSLDKVNRPPSRTQKTLKIGYLSSCLRRNSVGYLVRWTLQHHDRERFEIYAYSLKQTHDEVQQSIASNVCVFRDLSQGMDVPRMAEIIDRDEIDILIDLDSLTSSGGCSLMALKPAPVQITWLGFDASELPAIDYFLADPLVLPDSAQDYYTEKIWRLPNTYIAVDGFEVDVPTLRREQLEIPSNAVIYFCSQTGGKRHPDNVRSQMKILKAVPNSYFLIKGLYTDPESVRRFFEPIAAEEGVEFDRLRFLPSVSSEAVHRANIGIADVVLDTYPYHGTTTTLETLWMEVPIVTRVGKQFSSRQGYTLLTNAGITEGIAWTDEEYIEWGIRLGQNPQLRQQIAWKLRIAKQTSPLWDGQRFTRDLEQVYIDMWDIYTARSEK